MLAPERRPLAALIAIGVIALLATALASACQPPARSATLRDAPDATDLQHRFAAARP